MIHHIAAHIDLSLDHQKLISFILLQAPPMEPKLLLNNVFFYGAIETVELWQPFMSAPCSVISRFGNNDKGNF